LRKIIGKPYDTARLLDGVEAIFKSGWSLLKLYFMVGQPFETDDDIDGIIDLIYQIRKIGRSYRRKKAEINVSVSTFVPKPHTPFQWAGQTERKLLIGRIKHLQRKLRAPGIKFSYNHVTTSRLEALLARGSRDTGKIIYDAYQAGCRFDAWHESFNPDTWIQVLEQNNFDLERMACREYGLDERLPWAYIDAGISQETLKQSYVAARELSLKNDIPASSDVSLKLTEIQDRKGQPPMPNVQSAEQTVSRFLIFYRLQGPFRLFKHMEVSAALMRATRRAQLPIEFSYGYNPRPRFSFSTPAPLGFELCYEPFEMRLVQDLSAQDVLKRLNHELPSEMAAIAAIKPDEKQKPFAKMLSSMILGFQVDANMETSFKQMYAQALHYCRRQDLPEIVTKNIEVPESLNLFVTFPISSQPKIKLRDVIKVIYNQDMLPFNLFQAARICWNIDLEGKKPFLAGSGERNE